MKIALIIPAAGFSTRYTDAMKAEQGVDLAAVGRSKLDEDLGGRPVLHRTVELFTQGAGGMVDAVGLVVVAGPNDPAAFEAFKARHGDKLSLYGVRIVRGGVRHRYETVKAAIDAVPEDGAFTHIAVHDAARPCAPMELLDRIVGEAEKHAAVVPALDVSDTLKRVEEVEEQAEHDPLAAILGSVGGDGGGATRRVRRVVVTVDRARLVAVQTPQVFRADVLRRAYAQKDLTSTDDAQLVERLFAAEAARGGSGGAHGTGERVRVVEGDARNIKITRPMDLALARAILGVGGPSQRATHKRF